MTTDVSITPLGCRALGTRLRFLVQDVIQVAPEPVELDRGRALEDADGSIRSNEPLVSKGDQLADWNAVPGDDERFATVKSAHDVAALVAEFPLSDLSVHLAIVARVLHHRKAQVWSRERAPHMSWQERRGATF